MGAAKVQEAQEVQAVRVQVRCAINDLMEKETDNPPPLPSVAPLLPLSGSHIRSPRLPATSSASKIASHVHPLPSCDLIVEY